MIKESVKLKTVWRITKFRDEDGAIARMLKAGASIEDVIKAFPERFIADEVEIGNILLNEGATELWKLVIGQWAEVTNESIGTGDGTTTTFSATLTNKPVVPGSVSVTDGSETFTDNGDGTLTGDAGGSGTINYTTGEISVTFNTAPASGADITADYKWLNVFDETNAEIGVGDGTDAEDATQTDLVGTNTAYVGMDSGYPTVDGNTVTFRATFDGNTANFAWEEFTVRHKVTGININRKVVDKGTKASGETWVVNLQISMS